MGEILNRSGEREQASKWVNERGSERERTRPIGQRCVLSILRYEMVVVAVLAAAVLVAAMVEVVAVVVVPLLAVVVVVVVVLSYLPG